MSWVSHKPHVYKKMMGANICVLQICNFIFSTFIIQGKTDETQIRRQINER